MNAWASNIPLCPISAVNVQDSGSVIDLTVALAKQRLDFLASKINTAKLSAGVVTNREYPMSRARPGRSKRQNWPFNLLNILGKT